MENVIELLVYVTSFLLVMHVPGYCYIEPWQWSLGAVGVCLAWINLVLFLRKFPRFGIYVVMFTDVLHTFSKFFVVFFLFVISFGLAFFMTFQNRLAFRSVWSSLLKSAVMMVGEFEFDSLFNQPQEKHDEHLYLPSVSYFLFSLFVIIMTIILMNLLVGLAVDDIKGVQEKAKMKKMAMQVELVLDVEMSLPECLARKNVIKQLTIYPNRGINFISKISSLFWDEPSALSRQNISISCQHEDIRLQDSEISPAKMSFRIDNLQRRVTNLTVQSDRLQSMMQAALKHLNVPYKDDDF